jgi:hypothetical protein
VNADLSVIQPLLDVLLDKVSFKLDHLGPMNPLIFFLVMRLDLYSLMVFIAYFNRLVALSVYVETAPIF